MSFRARVFGSLVPIFFVLFVFTGLVDFYKQKQLAEDEVHERAKSMAENLAYSSRLAVLTEDKALLDAALGSVTGAADFAYVLVYGEKWTPLAQAVSNSAGPEVLQKPMEADHKQRLLARPEVLFRSVTAGKDRYVEYVAPITSAKSNLPFELRMEPRLAKQVGAEQNQQQTIGAVRLAVSLHRVDSQMASFLRWRGWSVLVFLCLSTVAIYIFSDRITRPINRLTEQAKKMSQGLLDETIPIESGDEIGQLATAFNQMARALNDQYLGLERKVAERTNELRAVNIKLAEASTHKSQFLANVNHELRTPLSSIIGYARLLRRETDGKLPAVQRENLNDLLRNAERLLGLIDSLLDFAQIETGKMDVHIRQVRVEELIQTAATTVDSMLNKDAVRLIRDVQANIAPLDTDPEKLRQIIFNLLGNAVKFTDHGEIKISACQENGNLKLAVADTGIGIDQADMERIFEEFDRGRLTGDMNYRGTGLGLTIVKRLVDVLGGSVAVESEVGKGSTFIVTLPMKTQKRSVVGV